MIELISKIVSDAQHYLQSTFNSITQIWVLTGLAAMFIIGLVIYICYSRSLGIPEGEE